MRLGLFGEIIDLAREDERVRPFIYRAVSGEDSFRNIIRGLIGIGFPFRVAGRFIRRGLGLRKKRGANVLPRNFNKDSNHREHRGHREK